MNHLKQIFLAARVNRTIPIIMVFLIPFAIANYFSKIYFVFIISTFFAYSSIGILNALKDNDYLLPKNSKKIAIIFFLLAIIISLQNKYAFYYILCLIILGLIYNEFSRKIPLGDSLIAGFTHFALPIIFSGMALELEKTILIPLSILFFFIAPFMAPTTNIKDIKEDKKRNYKSLVSIVKKPKIIVCLGLILVFITMNLIISFLTNPFQIIYSLPLLLFIYLISKKIIKNKFETALNLLRIYLALQILIIILILSKNPALILLSIFINILNLLYSIIRINYLERCRSN